jgi:hypothetical protein
LLLFIAIGWIGFTSYNGFSLINICLEDSTRLYVVGALCAPTLYYIEVLYECYGFIVLTLLLLINIHLSSMNTNIQGMQLRRT